MEKITMPKIFNLKKYSEYVIHPNIFLTKEAPKPLINMQIPKEVLPECMKAYNELQVALMKDIYNEISPETIQKINHTDIPETIQDFISQKIDNYIQEKEQGNVISLTKDELKKEFLSEVRVAAKKLLLEKIAKL
jgi:predicted ATP-grasp superfamily ATP-dependent carboligase